MFSEKENKVKKLIDEHVEKVGDCLHCFKGCFKAFLQGDSRRSEAVHENCDFAETEADILRRQIGDHLYSGAFLPIEMLGQNVPQCLTPFSIFLVPF